MLAHSHRARAWPVGSGAPLLSERSWCASAAACARSKFALYTAGLADYMHMKDEAAMWMRRVIHEFTPDNLQAVSSGH